jgi:hypothetical protein
MMVFSGGVTTFLANFQKDAILYQKSINYFQDDEPTMMVEKKTSSQKQSPKSPKSKLLDNASKVPRKKLPVKKPTEEKNR